MRVVMRRLLRVHGHAADGISHLGITGSSVMVVFHSNLLLTR